MIKRVCLALLGGSAVTTIPWAVSKLNYEQLWPVNLLEFPGAIVALVLYGNVHTISLTTVHLANVLLFAWAIFVCLHPKKSTLN
jgi:hypothetical protein